MALKKCKECGKQISTKTDKCPNCGVHIKKRIKIGCFGYAILIIFFLIIVGKLSNFYEETIDIQEQAKITEQKAKAAAELRTALRKKRLKSFNENKSTIIAELIDYYKKGDYQKVIAKAEKYLFIKDTDLKKIYDKAKSTRQQEILTQLKRIPVAEFEKNKNLYNELLSLYPNNEKYNKKYEYYSAKLEEKQKFAAEREKKIDRQFSWNGSHRNLQRFIKKIMNDPDSYDHVETLYWDMGNYLIVKTTFRGKNAFGGVVVNWIKAKVDLDGNIIEIMETYPYE